MDVTFLTLPYDAGHRGWRMGQGPAALLPVLTRGLEAAGHDVTVLEPPAPDDPPPGEIRLAFDLVSWMAQAATAAARSGSLPVALSGMCFASLGILPALRRPAGALWFDCHGDLNTPDTTRSGFLDGTALSTALGRCWNELALGIPGFSPLSPERVLLLGARDLDPAEEEQLEEGSLVRVTPDALARDPDGALATLDPREITELYVHLDLDVLDPSQGKVNAMALPGGATVEQIVEVLTEARSRYAIGGVTLSAYDPSQDPGGLVPGSAQTLLDALVS